MSVNNYSRKEEIINAITHGVPFALCLLLVPLLIYKANQTQKLEILLGYIVYGLGIFMVFFSSTFYHWVQSERPKYFLRKLDHISIYFLIAGTHTPLILLFMNTSTGRFYLLVLWLMVLGGTIYKIFFFGKYPMASVIFYLVMGWMAIFSLPAMFDQMSNSTFNALIFGGVLFTIGTIFFVWEKVAYSHAIWHLFVIGGTMAHYFALWEAI